MSEPVPLYTLIFPDRKTVIDMLKGFHICSGFIYHIPLNVIQYKLALGISGSDLLHAK